MKAIRIIGTEEEQGFMYGLYYACNGITGALTNTFALNVYKTAGNDMSSGFVRAVISGGSVAAVAGIILYFPYERGTKKTHPQQMTENRSSSSQIWVNF